MTDVLTAALWFLAGAASGFLVLLLWGLMAAAKQNEREDEWRRQHPYG